MMAHPPLEHSGVPLFVLQILEQVPQFAVSFLMFVSQPLVALPSQLPQPVSQAIPHPPEVQDGVPLLALQTLGHDPQCAGSLFKSASQPSPTKPLQFDQPAEHVVMEQALPEQADVAWFVLHARPQPPQFNALELVLVSQPFTKLLSQSPIGAVQAMPQVPLLHDGLPPDALHAFAHVPQWVASFLRLTSQPFATLPSQFAKFVAQLIWHAPAAQDAVPLLMLHAAVQVLQCSGSVPRFVSQPFVALPSQLPNPTLQVIPHTPLAQVAVPLVESQTVPQPPQFAGAVLTFVSQPFAALLSQLPNPVLQAMPQVPSVQDAVPLTVLHACPHAPQFAGVASMSTSHPLAALLSQLAKPVEHAIEHAPPAQDGVPWVVLQAPAQVLQCRASV